MERDICRSACNAAFLAQHKHYFVGYLTAGYPTTEDFFRLVQECEAGGMQIFEIGFPAKNPCCDGEIIKHAHSVIDASIANDLSFWRRLRSSISHPIWLMGYREDLIDSGVYRTLAQEKLMDALVIPNMDIDARIQLQQEMAPYGVDVLGFLSDAQPQAENDLALASFPLIYQQLYTGPTGAVNTSDDYLRLLAHAKENFKGYLFAGFGIGTAERARELLRNGFDGVIIGTAIMKKLGQSDQALLAFVGELETAVKEVQ